MLGIAKQMVKKTVNFGGQILTAFDPTHRAKRK